MKKLNINSNDMSNKDSKNKELEDVKSEDSKTKFNIVEFTMRDSSGMIIDNAIITVDSEKGVLTYKYLTEYGEYMPGNKDPIFSYTVEREDTLDNNIIFMKRINKLIDHSINMIIDVFKDVKKHNEDVIGKDLDIAMDLKRGKY